MNQEQSIGSNNQRQGLPENRKEQKVPGNIAQSSPKAQEPEKPAVTDDFGNVKNKEQDAGNGYSEKKETESWSQVRSKDDTASEKPPAQQPKEAEKVYGAGEKESTKHQHHSIDLPHQGEQEEKENHDKRARQSGDVPG